MKLIIDIPDEIYQEAIKSGYSHLYDEEVANAIAEGTPLDEVKAEIEASKWTDKDTRIERNALASGLEKAIEILDNIGKAESEEPDDKKA